MSSTSNNNKIMNENLFGQRYLENENSVFEYNAWDNVDWPVEKELEAQAIIEDQKLSAVLNSEELESLSFQKWNDFYSTHTNRFFMNRNWIAREFSELVSACSKVFFYAIYGCFFLEPYILY